ncbi:MAG: helix-turn-helix domain-containing protein [Clostridia bacterium]|nr:helix-turn-helix domain-containing protein [Clostridia bacterium]
MSNRLFQSIIRQTADVMKGTMGVIDDSSMIIACNDPSKIGENISSVNSDMMISGETFVSNGYTFKAFGNPSHPEFAVFVTGVDEAASRDAVLLSVAMNSVKQQNDEKYDKVNFIKNVLLDNVLPGDIYLKAREMKFNCDVNRVCMIVKVTSKSDASPFDVVQGLFPDKTKDFVISINENDIALVKEIKKDTDPKSLEKLAASIVDTLSGEYYTHAVVGVGTAVSGIRELARSFKEAQVSIEVGKVFDTEKNVITYDHLGIARLVYQLPTTLCETFLKEVFKKGSVTSMDHETLFTIQKFFENSLNVSETSRKLFVHRNTLVYRLEKIKKITGLDLREFEDAIVFKVALMVKKYLLSNPVKF